MREGWQDCQEDDERTYMKNRGEFIQNPENDLYFQNTTWRCQDKKRPCQPQETSDEGKELSYKGLGDGCSQPAWPAQPIL